MSRKKSLPPAALARPLEQRIRALAQLLEETGLSEIQLKENGQEIRVRRQFHAAAPAAPAASASPETPKAQAGDGGSDSRPDGKADAPEADADRLHPGAVTSPMVGTIYVAPEPGAKPFVQEGDKVKKGDILFIVEAMKTMNNIAAPKDGVVQKICVENAQPIEYDEVLAVIS